MHDAQVKGSRYYPDMRTAYALLGVVWVIIIGVGVWAVNHHFTPALQSEIVSSTTSTIMATTTLSITSPVFDNGGEIPSRYTCDGEQVSIPLSFGGVPEGTQSLALIVDDPDVPKQVKPDGMFVHWVLFNIPPMATGIPEGGSVGITAKNGAGQNFYAGPCPPKQYEPSEHRYFFKLYALDTLLQLTENTTKEDLLTAMQGHIIEEAQLLGRYQKK